MGNVIVYIATSLNGYVAGKDDDLAWLEAFNVPGEDHGYAEFMKNVGAAVMGARTYDQSLKHPERLMRGIKNYVLSHAPMDIPSGMDVEFYSGELVGWIGKIKRETEEDIFVVGGGQVVSSLLEAHLVDELRQFVAPVLIQEGVPLYPGLVAPIELTLVETRAYRTGIVGLRYVARHARPQ